MTAYSAMFAKVGRALLPTRWLYWTAGPIFEKELRVASRLRRGYVLRFAYLVLLTVFVALVWMSAVDIRYSGGPAYRIYRMAEAGKAVVAVIAWFQFCTMQLVAIIMLCNAIGEEINRRTLGLLMTTPINSFQIVMGKLLSRLLQLLLLLAVSVPLMIVVRVFGGVPWQFVAGSTCVTLTTALFAGALSMFFSVGTRRAYAVILKTIISMGILFLLFPVMAFLIREPSGMSDFVLWSQVNPYIAMAMLTENLMSPGAMGRFGFLWQTHCLVMLGLSALLVAACVVRVRKAALRQAVGETPQAWWRRRRRPPASDAAEALLAHGHIRRIHGSPVLWKELRAQFMRGRARKVVAVAAVLLVLVGSYVNFAVHHNLNDNDVHVGYLVIFVMLGLLATSVLSATSITSEKEAGTWPLLLTTTLSPAQILWGKALGALRRSAAAWSLVALHLAIFIGFRYIHPAAALHMAFVVAGAAAFLTGTGLFFSTVFRKTTAAVVVNLLLALTLWAIIPFVLAIGGDIAHSHDAVEDYICVNPVVQTGVVTAAASGSERARRSLRRLEYNWPNARGVGFVGTTLAVAGTAALYAALGCAAACLAGARLRRHPV